MAGVDRQDITPPVGIYHRMWGAALHDRSTGVHRPLTATALYLANARGLHSAADVRVAIAVDLCLLRPAEMAELLGKLRAATGLEEEQLLVFFSHTHAAGLMERGRAALPGGELIGPYLDSLAEKLAAAVQRARGRAAPAVIVYGTGRSSLAANRDYFDAARDRYVCGFNPEGETDDTAVVARVTHEDGSTLATVVNYACHPTTLAWQNTLISPDYVGAMRQVIERATGAPCLFLQGASGDLGPRDGFVGSVEVADRNGRQLGYAVLEALETLPQPGLSYEYVGPVISGATLGIWEYVPMDEDRRRQVRAWQTRRRIISLPYRSDLPRREALQRERRRWRQREHDARDAGDELRVREARAMVERITRSLTRIGHLPPGDAYPLPVDLWRVGDGFWIGLNGEYYHHLAKRLRARFPHLPILVGTLANGSHVSYLLDAGSYGKGLYQEEVSVLAAGCLERVEVFLAAQIEEMVGAG